MSKACQSAQEYTERNFSQFLLQYRAVQILNKIVEASVIQFFVGLIALGVPIATAAMYCSLTLWGEIDPITYVSFPTTCALCIGLALGFTLIGEIPILNCEQGRHEWFCRLKMKWVRKTIRSMYSVGAHMGPYGIVSRQLGMHICDDIINNTVDLLCITWDNYIG